MKLTQLAFIFAALALIVPAEAKTNKNANKSQQDIKKKREAEKEAREKKRVAVDDFLKNKDKNRDGSLTKEEYMSGESNAETAGTTFDQYNVNKDRYLTRNEIEALLKL